MERESMGQLCDIETNNDIFLYSTQPCRGNLLNIKVPQLPLPDLVGLCRDFPTPARVAGSLWHG